MDVRRPCNNRLCARWYCLLVLLSAFLAVDAMAQTRVEAGAVRVHSDNEMNSANWKSVDEGNGGRLAIYHDSGRLRLGFKYQRLDLDLSNTHPTLACNAITLVCHPIEQRFAFEDKFHSYELSLAWTWDLTPKLAVRANGAVVHETWSNDSIVFTYNLNPLTPSVRHHDQNFSTRTTTLAFGPELDIALNPAWSLALGLNYQHKTYRAMVAASRRPDGRRSLLEGIARLTRRFGEHVDAFAEIRPSDQRHYAHLGIGYRF